MTDILALAGGILLLFLASTLISYGAVRMLNRKNAIEAPAPDTAVRIRSTMGMHRSRFVAEEAAGWLFTAPIGRDHYVPLRVGEPLTIESVHESGLILYRSTVAERRMDPHVIVAHRPFSVSRVERRTDNRRKDVAGAVVGVDGAEGVLRDLSAHGAKVKVAYGRTPGERVRLDFPWRAEPVFACVLDLDSDSRSAPAWSEIRVVFEKAVEWGAEKVKTAPAV